MYDLIDAAKRGAATPQRILPVLAGNVGANLYSYKIMLEAIGREKESGLIEEYQDVCFSIRDVLQKATFTPETWGDRLPDFEKLIARVDALHKLVKTHRTMLQEHAPKEEQILSATMDDLVYLGGQIKAIFIKSQEA